MKINSISSYSQNKQQKPSFEAKATLLVLEKGAKLSDDFVDHLAIQGILKLGEDAKINEIEENGLRGIIFNFPSVAKEKLAEFLSGSPEGIKIKVED